MITCYNVVTNNDPEKHRNNIRQLEMWKRRPQTIETSMIIKDLEIAVEGYIRRNKYERLQEK